jgi:cellulose synthase/poly-beta-1,6-N-acetylglucosamine synthase-like glycosyltransferase
VEKLAIVTFISNNETPNINLFPLIGDLRSVVKNVKMIIYANDVMNEKIPADNDIDVIVNRGTTKYRRILMSIDYVESDNILFIDNDITPNRDNLRKFVSGIDKNIDLAWGYIGVSENYGLMSKLLAIDKALSHKILRPFLWKRNIGISVPGQMFFINAPKFRRDLPQYDTVFDDLTIGISAKRHNYTIVSSPLYLGYEKPSLSFRLLFKQRIRWAKGYYQSITNNMHTEMWPYVLIHGFAYHFLWLPVWMIIILTGIFSLQLGFLFLIIICACLCDKKITLIGYSFIYIIIFPIIHIIWLFAFIYNIIKGEKVSEKNHET